MVKKITLIVLGASSKLKFIPNVTEIYLKWSFAQWLWCLESDLTKQISGDELRRRDGVTEIPIKCFVETNHFRLISRASIYLHLLYFHLYLYLLAFRMYWA
ncbi:unnamed protein product [Eruca vesicaria subsp. sativa]|uniref:Uncharacterized protein n=1 Tax=Eruca vesicaria subsp. sativa TaxID=29727 RepID=A0ABC8LE28_ERUVS|nr:unnamed protein product [Eruca vesicaria subsp. sativa]